MNIKMTTVAVAIIASSSAALAADDFVDYTNVPSTRTRAEVRAELESAYTQGTLHHAPEYVEHTHAASTKSREEVRNEAIQATKARRDLTSHYGS